MSMLGGDGTYENLNVSCIKYIPFLDNDWADRKIAIKCRSTLFFMSSGSYWVYQIANLINGTLIVNVELCISLFLFFFHTPLFVSLETTSEQIEL